MTPVIVLAREDVGVMAHKAWWMFTAHDDHPECPKLNYGEVMRAFRALQLAQHSAYAMSHGEVFDMKLPQWFDTPGPHRWQRPDDTRALADQIDQSIDNCISQDHVLFLPDRHHLDLEMMKEFAILLAEEKVEAAVG